MIEIFKKVDKKFLILSACIIFIPIFIVIFLAIIQSCSNSKMNYENYEKKMISAAEKYLDKENKIPVDEGQLVTLKLDTLVKKGYIKSPKRALGDESCSGIVRVRRNGSSIEINDGGFLNYTVSLDCDNYKTPTLISSLTSNVVTSESGLYLVGNEYIFKGNKVNNHITFFGHTYRIMSIDKDGIVRLIRDEVETGSRYWDKKYNTEVNLTYGKSIYKDSGMLGYLIRVYKNSKKINKKAKSHIVAYDTCVGKRDKNDFSINKDLDCSQKLEKQVISLPTISDFASVSLDPDCNSIMAKACRNYNYLYTVASSTWTSNSISNNTYEVYYIGDGIAEHMKASSYRPYNFIIYIDGYELYNQGTGSEESPYIIN